MATGYSASLPLTFDQVDGPYKLNKTLKEVGRQNLKMLVLTNPGERIMNPDFGVGISQFIFEPETDIMLLNIRQRIINQVQEYLPYILLNSIKISRMEDFENGVSVRIDYSIESVAFRETLEVGITS